MTLKSFNPEISKRGYILCALCLLMFVGAFVRLHTLGSKSIWVDEFITYDISHGGTNPLKTPHPVYFCLTKLSASLGEGLFYIRLPSAVLGTLGILAIFLLGRSTLGLTGGFIIALIVTFWTDQVNYSQEARYYSSMFCYATFAFYSLIAFTHPGRWWTLPAALLFAFISYLNHPTAAVFLLSFIFFIPLWLLFFPVGRKRVFNGLQNDFYKLSPKALRRKPAAEQKSKKSHKRKSHDKMKVYIRILVIVLTIIALGLLLYLSRGLLRRAYSYLKNPQFARTPDVEFTLSFFIQHIVQFTPELGMHPLFRDFSYVLVIIGFLIIAVRYTAFFVYYCLLLISTFTAVFIVTMGQTYAPKYILFLSPVVVLAFVAGILFVAEQTRKIHIHNVHKNFTYSLTIAVFLFLFIYPSIIRLIRYWGEERNDIRNPLKYIQQSIDENDIVAGFDLANEPMQFHSAELGIAPERMMYLAKERGLGHIALGKIKKACLYHDDVWFINLWPERMPALLRDWIYEHFLVVHTFPSMYRRSEVSLMKWKYTSAYMYSGKPLDFLFSTPQSSKDFMLSFLTEKKWQCSVDITVSNESSIELNPAITIDDIPGSSQKIAPAQKSLITGIFNLLPGVHRIACSLADDKNAGAKLLKIEHIKISPVINDEYILEAEEPDNIHPTWYKETQRDGDTTYLRLMRNSFAEYRFDCPESAPYGLSVRARNDTPGPALIEVSLNNSPVGIFNFSKKDNSWEEKTLPVILNQGLNTISLTFLNDYQARDSSGDNDNDAFIDHITLQRVSRVSDVPDMRWRIYDALYFPANTRPFEMLTGTGSDLQFSPAWSIYGEGAELSEIIPSDNPSYRGSVKFKIHHDGKGARIVSPVFEISPSNILYWSVWLKTEHLINHSANACVLYLNNKNAIIGMSWAAIEGLSGTTDWIRHVYFLSSPPDTARATLFINIYLNSRRPSTRDGFVFCRDLKFEKITE